MLSYKEGKNSTISSTDLERKAFHQNNTIHSTLKKMQVINLVRRIHAIGTLFNKLQEKSFWSQPLHVFYCIGSKYM